MKRRILLVTLPILLAAGCASHPKYETVAVVPAHGGHDVVVVPEPVSDRSVIRVYPSGPAVVGTSALPPGVSPTEHAIAENIRSTFNSDPGWAGLTHNVEIRVSGTTVDLTGTVASDSIRDRIEEKVHAIPGVTDVDNGLRVVTP